MFRIIRILRNVRIWIALSSLFALLTVFGMNCGEDELFRKPVRTKGRPRPIQFPTRSPLSSFNAEIRGDFCLSPPEDVNPKVKILFIVDHSGSNGDTDRLNIKRNGNIRAFFEKYKNNPMIEWGLIVFSTSLPHDAMPLIGTQNEPKFSSNLAEVDAAITQQRNIGPSGNTPYGAGLDLAEIAIRRDKAANPGVLAIYNILFLSDGGPTDSNPKYQPTYFIPQIENLAEISPNFVHFSTLYYNSKNPGPVEREGLRTLAEVGKGKFFDLNTDDDGRVDLTTLMFFDSTPQTFRLDTFLVYNMTTTVCTDNTVDVDSDMDGLCDKDEIALKQKGQGNYNPTNRNSFSAAYSDGVYYSMKKADPTRTPQCPPDVEDATIDRDGDFLTNCEERFLFNSGHELLTAQNNNPDTDNDGILDHLEFYTLHERSAAVNLGNLLRKYDEDPENAYEQIAQHRSPLLADANIPSSQKYNFRVVPTGRNALNQECFNVTQTTLPTYETLAANFPSKPELSHAAKENVILIYFVERSDTDSTAPGRVFYKYVKVKAAKGISSITPAEAKIIFNQGQFQRMTAP